MSESKSDALTNLATPLHRRTVQINCPPQTFNFFFSVGSPTDERVNCQAAAHSANPILRHILWHRHGGLIA